MDKTERLSSGEWGCLLNNDPQLTVGQPNSRSKIIELSEVVNFIFTLLYVMFFNFWALFLEIYILDVASFFLPCTIFSGSSNLYDSSFWWNIFSSLETLLLSLTMCHFPVSTATIVKKTNFLNKLCRLSILNPNYPWNNWSQIDRLYSRKIVPKMYFLPHCRGPRP